MNANHLWNLKPFKSNTVIESQIIGPFTLIHRWLWVTFEYLFINKALWPQYSLVSASLRAPMVMYWYKFLVSFFLKRDKMKQKGSQIRLPNLGDCLHLIQWKLYLDTAQWELSLLERGGDNQKVKVFNNIPYSLICKQ